MFLSPLLWWNDCLMHGLELGTLQNQRGCIILCNLMDKKKKYIWLIREGWQCFISPSVRDEDGRVSRISRFLFALGAFLLLLWAALQAWQSQLQWRKWYAFILTLCELIIQSIAFELEAFSLSGSSYESKGSALIQCLCLWCWVHSVAQSFCSLL